MPVVPAARPQEVVFTDGSSVTTPINLGGATLVGVYLPPEFDGAELTFQSSPNPGNGGPWFDVQYDGAELFEAVTAGGYIAVNPAPFIGVNNMRIRSGTAAAPTAQAGDVTLTLMLAEG